ncbi:MAG: TetR/AcrR family transcriptional regulator [Polyangiales bacterium]
MSDRPPEIPKDLARPERRTQRDRREGTIAKLIDATIASLLEVGYARSSVKEICARAGVSHGGLFRHFDSMIDLFMAASDEVGRRQLAYVEGGLARAAATEEPLVTVLHLLRDASRDPINDVFRELIVAARTDPALHEALSAFGARYAQTIWESVSRMRSAERFRPEVLAVLISSVLLLFEGESLTRTVHAVPELEDSRMKLLELFVQTLAANPDAIRVPRSGPRGE